MWSGPADTCPPGCTDAPPTLEFPFVTGNNYESGFTPSGNGPTLFCSDEITSLSIICGADGTWGEVSGVCPIGCADTAPEIDFSTNDYVPGFNAEATVVTYTCDLLDIAKTSTCQADGTWTTVTSCPVLKSIGSSFFPSVTATSAVIMSHPGYEWGAKYPSNKVSEWYFYPTGTNCKPTVEFIGDIFQIIGKKKCREDNLIIQQWYNHQLWKWGPYCGTSIPKNVRKVEPKWDHVRLRFIFKTNGADNGLGFKALISYDHCF